jgi:hypothetical protein
MPLTARGTLAAAAAAPGAHTCTRPYYQTMRDIFTHMETSNVAFSPDGRTLLAGTNAQPKSGAAGVLKFFSVYGAAGSVVEQPELACGVAQPGESVVRVLWHPKLKQILATTSGGYTKVGARARACSVRCDVWCVMARIAAADRRNQCCCIGTGGGALAASADGPLTLMRALIQDQTRRLQTLLER